MIRTEAVIRVFEQFGDFPQRKMIARVLKQDNGEDMLRDIADAGHKVSVRRWAVEGLAQGSHRSSVAIAKRALRDPNMSVRLHAMIGFGFSGKRNRVRWLEPCLFDESGGIRVNAVAILGEHYPSVIKRNLVKLAKDKKPYVIQQLRKLGY